MIFLAVDPSSNFIGVSALFIDPSTFEIKHIETECINLKQHRFSEDSYEPLISRISILEIEFKAILEHYNPKLLVYERGFINVKRPGAFGPINASTTMMSHLAQRFNRNIIITKFSPGQVKNALGQKGNCSKEDMFEACLKNQTLNKHINAAEISEHEIDASSVGLCAIDFYKNRKSLLF